MAVKTDEYGNPIGSAKTDEYGNPVTTAAQPTTAAPTTTAAPVIDASGRAVKPVAKPAAQPVAQTAPAPAGPAARPDQMPARPYSPSTLNALTGETLTGPRPMIDQTPVKTDAQREFDALPFWRKPIEWGARALNTGTDFLGMGWGTKADAKIATSLPSWVPGSSSKSYEDELAARRAQINKSYDVTGEAGPLLATAATAGIPLSGVERAANWAFPVGKDFITGFGNTLGRFGTRLVGGALEGGAYGAANAGGHDQPIVPGALSGAEWGAGGATLIPMIPSLTQQLHARQTTPIMNTEQLQQRYKQLYQPLDTGGHMWHGTDWDRTWNNVQTDPRVRPALVRNTATGEYSGPNRGTSQGVQFTNDLNADRTLRQGPGAPVTFNELDAAYHNNRAQTQASPEAGGDLPGAHYNPGPVVTSGINDFLHTPTTMGIDIGPQLDAARAAFANHENSTMFDKYAATHDPSEIQQALWGQNSQTFYTPQQRQAMADLLAAHNDAAAGGPWSRAIRQTAGAVTTAGVGAATGSPLTGLVAGQATRTGMEVAQRAATSRAVARALDDARRTLTNQAPATGSTFQDAINSATQRDRLTRLLLMGAVGQPRPYADQSQ